MRALLFLAGSLTLAAQTAAPSYKALKFPPLKPVQIPEPVVHTLPNGLKIYLLENHELPLINGVALVRTGNLFDPADKRGLALVPLSETVRDISLEPPAAARVRLRQLKPKPLSRMPFIGIKVVRVLQPPTHCDR